MRWAALLLATALAACNPAPERPPPPDSGAPDIDDPADRVAALARHAGWIVQEGQLAFATMAYCCEPEGVCLGNNPSTPYGTVALPPAPDQAVDNADTFWAWGPVAPGLSRSWRARADEVVLVVGEAPPRAKYFSVRSSIATRTDEGGRRELVLGALGPSLNHLAIEARQGAFWGQPTAVVSTADAHAERLVTAWLSAAGWPEQAVHFDRIAAGDVRFGAGPDADTLSIAMRVAVPDDPAAFATYADDPPVRVLRMSPPPGFAREPMGRQPLPERGSGEDESGWADLVTALGAAVVARFPDRAWATSPVSSIYNPTYDCIETTTCTGDNTDRLSARAENMVLDTDELAVVFGVNHERTGRAAYMNFAVMVTDHWVGATAVDSAAMVGSARPWLGDADPRVDDLYAYVLARDCAGFAEPCVEVERACPWPDLDESFFVNWRYYLDPATGAAPLQTELVPDTIVKFGPPGSAGTGP